MTRRRPHHRRQAVLPGQSADAPPFRQVCESEKASVSLHGGFFTLSNADEDQTLVVALRGRPLNYPARLVVLILWQFAQTTSH